MINQNPEQIARDNIDKQFLGKTITKYAEWESIKILYHPVTQKHLG